MKLYDIIIIGAGPAGLMAARELERNNIDYLIIEAKRKVGYPLKCGEITREETLAEFFAPRDYPFIKNNITRISFRIHDTQKIVKKNMLMFDKVEFLRWLSEPVKDNLSLGTKLLEIQKEKNFAEIRTSKGVFHAKLVILANGTNYRIQKDLNLLKKNVELIPCIGGLFKNATLRHDTAYFYYDEKLYLASWIFPKEGNIFNAGTGIILNKPMTESLNLKSAFNKTMEKLGIILEGEPGFGGNYVTSGPIHQTYSAGLLVCGDAAGHVFGAIGEGIYFALKAGRLAGQTAVRAVENNTFSREFLKVYEADWKKSFGRQMTAGIVLATCLFFLMQKQLTRSALKIIKPPEIADTWFNGKISFRIRFLYYLLKLIGCSPTR